MQDCILTGLAHHDTYVSIIITCTFDSTNWHLQVHIVNINGAPGNSSLWVAKCPKVNPDCHLWVLSNALTGRRHPPAKHDFFLLVQKQSQPEETEYANIKEHTFFFFRMLGTSYIQIFNSNYKQCVLFIEISGGVHRSARITVYI